MSVLTPILPCSKIAVMIGKSGLAVLAALAIALGVNCGCPAADKSVDPLAAWRQGVKVSPVLPIGGDGDGHSLHAYYVASPESPDGRYVVYYWSAADTGYEGEVRILERATGKVRTLAKDVAVEDAHRGACQQWSAGGKKVVFHNVLKDGTWIVACVDVKSGEQTILARDRQ